MPEHFTVWGPKSGKSVHWISWSRGATGFSLQKGKALGFTLFKCYFEQVCWMGSVVSFVLWLGFWVGGLKPVFNKWDYKFVSLTRHSRRSRSSSKDTNVLCGFDLSWPIPWVPAEQSHLLSLWGCSALPTLRLKFAGLYSFHVFLPVLSLRWDWGYNLVWLGLWLFFCLAVGRSGYRASKTPCLWTWIVQSYTWSDCKWAKPVAGTTI